MLVLTRKAGQSVRLGDDVVVTVLAVSGQSVRLGIEAPDSVPVWRGELLDSERLALRDLPDSGHGATKS